MASGIRVELNHAGMEQLLKSAELAAHLRDRGARVADAIRATAPVITGQYRDGVTVIEEVTDRAVVRIGSTAPYADQVEAEHGTVARALDAAGGAR